MKNHQERILTRDKNSSGVISLFAFYLLVPLLCELTFIWTYHILGFVSHIGGSQCACVRASVGVSAWAH